MVGRELKRLGSQSMLYGLGGLISRFIAFFLLPVYTAYLGRVGLGKIETIVAFTAVDQLRLFEPAVVLVGAGLGVAAWALKMK